jgi:hypothetical protein
MGILTAVEPEGQHEVGGPVKQVHSFGLPANGSHSSSQHTDLAVAVQERELGFLPFKLRPLASELEGSLQEDVLLLAWLLVLSRYSVDGDVSFGWGCDELDSEGACEPSFPSTLSTADIRLDKEASALSLLESVKARSSHGGDLIFFFTDAASAPSNGHAENAEPSVSRIPEPIRSL